MQFSYCKALVLGFILLLGNVRSNHRTKRVIAFPEGSTMFSYIARGWMGLKQFLKELRLCAVFTQEAWLACLDKWSCQIQATTLAFCGEYRVNYKLNLLPYTTLFAQASGVKVAWKLPSGSRFRTSRSASDLHDMAELMYERHGYDGKICVLKNICQAMEYVREHDGVMSKILRLIIGSNGNSTSSVDPLECDNYSDYCPLELDSVWGLDEY